ncbi:MAG: UDP-glucose--hexose-1-phosphate uridylyltransferase [Elusimicrobiaceae bacterium]|nr:UDP-glucose--hexose-1-phosphate uridylyltransferase [Elusimicrobiaceae bacterium]
MNVNLWIDKLVLYALRQQLIVPQDRVWAVNQLLSILQIDDYKPTGFSGKTPQYPCEILSKLCDFAAQKGLIVPDTVTMRDLFDTKIMGVFAKRPSETIAEFFQLLKTDPRKATDKFYHDACALDYIRTARVAKNLAWKSRTAYGNLDITINMSKPEKDPKDIEMALHAKSSAYPACLLCKENEGYAGRINHPARQTIRLIPLDLLKDGHPWYLQYSPYGYYREHCICLSDKHEPMKLTQKSFARLLNFVALFPHYFIGSNADLPIVGGSILTHDHFQGGRYVFAMEKAPLEKTFQLTQFPAVKAGIVKWPMSVIRLSGKKQDLIEAGAYILKKWRGYSDLNADIIAKTGNTVHNTITPIARRRGRVFELDLVLRNNRTTPQFPMGLFHPHAEVHHIKKENIGLIEVMGLAVLPARLAQELNDLKPYLIRRDLTGLSKHESLKKHAIWASDLLEKHQFTARNVTKILRAEVGNVFAKVLEYAGVYKRTPEGKKAFDRFIQKL